jgi:cellulose synthase/poly-beta-1,6-N-acetylglucosamine synthase-like glycosyltransferase
MRNGFKAFVYIFLYAVTIAMIVSTFFVHPIDRTTFPMLRTIIVIFATVLLTKYFVYMALSPIYDIVKARHDAKFRDVIATYRPKVSVIIPCWNEAVGILGTVRSILANTYEYIELVIVNDGSTDQSDAIIRQFMQDYETEAHLSPGKSILYRYKENGGKARALNAGIEVATGDIIMSIDADCNVMPNAIESFVAWFADPEVMAAVGNVKIGNTRTLVGTVQYLEYLFSFYCKKADSVLNTVYIIGGAAGAFRREIFEQLGGYTTEVITEDIELTMRIQMAGMKIIYSADSVVYTEGASDVRGLMKQRLRWRQGRVQTFWKYRSLFLKSDGSINKLVSWIVLPLALFGDVQLSVEIFFIMFLYFYSFWTHNFSVFISGIIVVGSMFAVQIFNEKEEARKLSFIVMAPIGWLLFYLSTYVEHNALLRSLWTVMRRREVTWQRWQRKGVNDA